MMILLAKGEDLGCMNMNNENAGLQWLIDKQNRHWVAQLPFGIMESAVEKYQKQYIHEQMLI